MKTLNDYMKMNYRMEIVEDADEGGFVVSFPELPGCLTCGETVETAIKNAVDAKKYGSKLRLKKKSKFTSQIVWRSIQGSLS